LHYRLQRRLLPRLQLQELRRRRLRLLGGVVIAPERRRPRLRGVAIRGHRDRGLLQRKPCFYGGVLEGGGARGGGGAQLLALACMRPQARLRATEWAERLCTVEVARGCYELGVRVQDRVVAVAVRRGDRSLGRATGSS
jgi:hypothetical protein